MIVLFFFFFFSSRRRHTRCSRDWSSDVCSSDLRSVNRPVIMLEVADHPLLQRAVLERKSVHLADAANEGDWREIKCLGKVGSCMAVPLVVGEMLQGLLLVASVNPETFTRALCGHVGLVFSVN